MGMGGEDDDGDDGTAVRALPPRMVISREQARRLGELHEFWCARKCFVWEILNAREIIVVDDGGDGGDAIAERSRADASTGSVSDGVLASELYEMATPDARACVSVGRESRPQSVIRRVDICGFVVERRTRKDSKVIFTLDDGSGCIECVVWTQDTDGASNGSAELFGIAGTADGAAVMVKGIRVGTLARVQGKIRDWEGHRQINAIGVQVDLDPNQELLFWLDVAGAGNAE
jgi:hypothetical protein